MVHGQGGVGVGGEISGAAAREVLVRRGYFEVIHVEVEPGQHDPYLWIEMRAVRQAREIGLSDVAPERRVGAADKGHVFGAELRFDAGFAQYKDLVLGRGQVENAVDVNSCRVGRAEHVVDVALDALGLELFQVVGSGLCGVVGDKDGSFACSP